LAFARLHAFLQLPQLFTSALVLTSHPFVGLPSQSAKPVLQDTIVQAPFVHVALALVREHLLPQAPQLLGSVWRLTSQPSLTVPLQLAKFGLQLAMEHDPLEQAGVA